MDKLKSEYTSFRERIFGQDIDSSQIKQFSDKVKQQLTSQEGERNPYSLICLLENMYSHNKSINTGAAPTIDTVHLFDLNLSLNQLQSLKRSVQKLEYPEQILDSLNFLYSFMLSDNNSKLFLMNCKIINDILFHYKKTLKLKNEEYQSRSLEQIDFLIEYGKKNNSTLLLHHLETNGIDSLLKSVSQRQDTSPDIKQKCVHLLDCYFSDQDEDEDEQEVSSSQSGSEDGENIVVSQLN